jgi:hypothetical protein
MLVGEGRLLRRKCLSHSPFVAMMKANFGKFYHHAQYRQLNGSRFRGILG